MTVTTSNSSWDYCGSSLNCTFSDTEVYTGSTSIKMTKVGAPAGLLAKNVSIAAPGYIEFRLYMEGCGADNFFRVRGSGQTLVEVAHEFNAGGLHYRDMYAYDGPSNKYKFMTATLDHWYHFLIIPDAATGTYQIWVDGVQEMVNGKTDPAMRYAYAATYFYISQPESYIDEVYVRGFPAPDSDSIDRVITRMTQAECTEAIIEHGYDSAMRARLLFSGDRHKQRLEVGQSISLRIGHEDYMTTRQFIGYITDIRCVHRGIVEVVAHDALASLQREYPTPPADWTGYHAVGAIADMLGDSSGCGSVDLTRLHGSDPAVMIGVEDAVTADGETSYWELIQRVLDMMYDASTTTNTRKYHLWLEHDVANSKTYARVECEADLSSSPVPVIKAERGTRDAHPRTRALAVSRLRDGLCTSCIARSASDPSQTATYTDSHAAALYGTLTDMIEADTLCTDTLQARAAEHVQARRTPAYRVEAEILGGEVAVLNDIVTVDMPEAGLYDQDLLVCGWASRYGRSESHTLELGTRRERFSDYL